MNPSKSYNPGACCGEDCRFFHDQEKYGQCWGDVEVVDEEGWETDDDCGWDYFWVHSCQGHIDCWETYNKENYKPEIEESV